MEEDVKLVEERSEEARKKVAYYEDTAKILVEEGIYDVAVDFYTLAGMYSLLAEDKEGKKYVEKAIEICQKHGVSDHRRVFADIGLRMFEGRYEEVEEEWSKIKAEYTEEEDQLVRELLEVLKATKVREESQETVEVEGWEIVEEEAPLQMEEEGVKREAVEVKSEEGVGVRESTSITVIDSENVYGRMSISDIAWRVGESAERIRQVLSALIQSGRLPGKIEGDEYIQSEGVISQATQITPKPRSVETKVTFFAALKEKDVKAPTRPGYKRCGVCGEEIPEYLMICSYCGARQ
ncbi:MAG: hypothetical protein QXK94_02575 [Candidatus Jordarchaeales archaeon]